MLETRRTVRPFIVELSFIQFHGLFRNRGELGAAVRVCSQRLKAPPLPPTPLFCLMEQKHTDLQKFTQTTGSSSPKSPRLLSVSHTDTRIYSRLEPSPEILSGGWMRWLWGIFRAHRVIYWLVSCATLKDTRLLMSCHICFSCFWFHDLWTGISRVQFGLLVAVEHLFSLICILYRFYTYYIYFLGCHDNTN